MDRVGTSSTVDVLGMTFEISGAGGDITASVGTIPGLAETALLRLSMPRSCAASAVVAPLEIRCRVPAIDMHGFYGGPPELVELTRLPFWRFARRTSAQTGYPYISLFHRSGRNRLAVGFADQLNEVALDGALSEATRAFKLTWRKADRTMPAERTPWNEVVFVSRSDRPWSEVLQAYVAVVEAEAPEPRLPVPEAAFEPVFCTWTAVHHDVSDDWISRTARIAADLGFGTWLTDDGWFTDAGAFGDYRHAGDWIPSERRFPDLADHVARIQALGLRYVLWVAPFMVGDASLAATRYADLLEEPTQRLAYANLNPRRPETATLVLELVERLLGYGVDGLKVDFIDSIALEGPNDGDGPPVGPAVHAILSAAIDRASQLRPDVLVEVRNTYANLAARRYANLFRASDVPINFAANRWQVTMLRLLVPDRAVHLDPALWHPDDSDENVAVHLINLISSVPTVGIDLERYPSSHLALLRYWIGFYRGHRATIVHGRFEPEIHMGHVPLTRFIGRDETIVGLYSDVGFELPEAPVTWILNASTRPYVDLLPGSVAGPARVVRYDRYGERLAEEEVRLPVAHLPVEVGGSVQVQPT